MEKKIKVEIDSFLKEIIPKFLESRQNDIQILRDHLAKENYEQIESMAHKIKGNAGSYGLDELGKLGGELEQHCIEEEYAKIPNIINAMEKYLSQIVITYIDR